jgi:transposase-like protein
MLLKYSRISKYKRKKILELFSEDINAIKVSRLVGVNRNTVHLYFKIFRENIAKYQEEQILKEGGEFELDESYFGGVKKKNQADERRKRGRGAENKIPVFGIKKRNDGKVYTQIVENASKSTLLPIIRKMIKSTDSIIYTDKWKSYDGLILDGYKHQRVNHSKRYSNRNGTHINGIENFWSFSKRRLAKFNGVSRKTFYLHLKESEFRYNNKHDILKILLKINKEMLG